MKRVAHPQRRLLAGAYRHSFVRFACFGLLGLAFDVGLLGLLVAFTAVPQIVAVMIAFATTYALNFTLNRRFSFTAEGKIGSQLTRFAPQVSLDLILTLTAVQALTGLGFALFVARILAGGSNAAINYAMYRWWTFRSSQPVEARSGVVDARTESMLGRQGGRG